MCGQPLLSFVTVFGRLTVSIWGWICTLVTLFYGVNLLIIISTSQPLKTVEGTCQVKTKMTQMEKFSSRKPTLKTRGMEF